MSEDPCWKRCSVCKQPIGFAATYWVCSVSTCNRSRTALRFCSVSCWDGHLPVARHREAWAEERRAPAGPEAEQVAGAPPSPRQATRPKRRVFASGPASPPAAMASTPAASGSPGADEVLIVASRLKDFVRAESGFNTSDRVLAPLSDIVRKACRQAIENAERDGRKTILDRDVPRP